MGKPTHKSLTIIFAVCLIVLALANTIMAELGYEGFEFDPDAAHWVDLATWSATAVAVIVLRSITGEPIDSTIAEVLRRLFGRE